MGKVPQVSVGKCSKLKVGIIRNKNKLGQAVLSSAQSEDHIATLVLTERLLVKDVVGLKIRFDAPPTHGQMD